MELTETEFCNQCARLVELTEHTETPWRLMKVRIINNNNNKHNFQSSTSPYLHREFITKRENNDFWCHKIDICFNGAYNVPQLWTLVHGNGNIIIINKY